MTFETRLQDTLEAQRQALPPFVDDYARVQRRGHRRLLGRRSATAVAGVAAMLLVVIGAGYLTGSSTDPAGTTSEIGSPFVVAGEDLPPELVSTLNRKTITTIEDDSVDGDPRLVPPTGTVLRELHYSNQAGDFDLISFEGFAFDLSALRDIYSDSRRLTINGYEAVATFDNSGTLFVVWNVTDALSVGVQSTNTLTSEQVEMIALTVHSIDEGTWESLPATVDG